MLWGVVWCCTLASHLQNILFEEPDTLKAVVPHQAGMEDILRKEYLMNMWEGSFSSKNNRIVSLSFPLLNYDDTGPSQTWHPFFGLELQNDKSEWKQEDIISNLGTCKYPYCSQPKRAVQPKNFHPYVCFFPSFPKKFTLQISSDHCHYKNITATFLNFSM